MIRPAGSTTAAACGMRVCIYQVYIYVHHAVQCRHSPACITRRQVTHSTRYQVYVCTYQVYVSEEKQSKINVARRRHVVGWPRNNNTMVINGA